MSSHSTTAILQELGLTSPCTTPPIPEYLELIDIDAFTKQQLSLDGPIGSSNRFGWPSVVGTLLLGAGGSFTVRRVPYDSMAHPVDVWNEPFIQDKRFVVVKQPSVNHKREGCRWDKQLRDVMMELKILSHNPIRRHPNIIKLHSFMWDSQSNLATALAPSLILEYADLGTLSDFQDIHRLVLLSTTKRDICVDVAEGLRFLSECGIVHGDVKSQNILLFRDELGHPYREPTIRAKISDFGCSLIGMSDDVDCPKQRLWGTTDLWAAPERVSQEDCLDFLSLRRRDLYSYGLLVWQIMCDGQEPWRLLGWDPEHTHITVQSEENVVRPVNRADFNGLKSKSDSLLTLAMEMLYCWPGIAENFDRARIVLEVTVRRDPGLRTRSFSEIIAMWKGASDAARERLPEAVPLSKGDFGITSPMFPKNIHILRATPSSFRHLVCDQLSKQAQYSGLTLERANSFYAVAVCHLQGFYQDNVEGRTLEATQEERLKNAAAAILQAAGLGHILARALLPGILEATKLPRTSWPREQTLNEWLIDAVRQGSIRARFELQKRYPKTYDAIVADIRDTRRRCGCSLVNEMAPVNPAFFDSFPSLDPIARMLLSQPEISRLHQAAYLGSLDGCQYLLERGKLSVNHPSSQGCGPLHFAARNSQVEVARYLAKKGSDIDAQDRDGMTALHMALLSFNPEDMLRMLLAQGADPNRLAKSPSGQTWIPDCYDYFIHPEGTPLHFAIRAQNMSAVTILLAGRADPNKRSTSGVTPFELCVQMRSSQLLEIVLPFAVQDPTNLPNPHGLYPCLVGFDISQMTRTLYWQGESSMSYIIPLVNRIRSHQVSLDDKGIMHWALDANQPEILDYYLQRLLLSGGNLAGPYRFRKIGYDSEESIVLDVALGDNLMTILSNVLSARDKAMAMTVLKQVPKPLPLSGSYGRPWLVIIGERPLEPREHVQELVSALIKAGADMGATDYQGNGPLYSAALWNNYNAVNVLLTRKPNVIDAQRAINLCIAKGLHMVASSILSAIFTKCPQVLTVQLMKLNNDAPLSIILDTKYTDFNYVRSFCDMNEFSRDESVNLSLLQEVIQTTETQADGADALRQRLQEQSFFGLPSPLHCAAKTGSVQLANALLKEPAVEVNAMPLLQMSNFDITLSQEEGKAIMPGLTDPMAALSSGPTPLDCAYDRNWNMSLFQWPERDRLLIDQLRSAGGAHKELDDFEQRTQNMIKLLRGAGGKTKEEIFHDNPSYRTDMESRDAARAESRKAFVEKIKQSEPSATSRQIQEFWGEVCRLPSAHMTQQRYPGLLESADSTRPRFSELAQEAIELFRQCLQHTSHVFDSNLRPELAEKRSKFEKWAEYNDVLSGELDTTQDVPPTTASHLLSSGVFIALHEFIRILKYFSVILQEQINMLDHQYRCQELFRDLDKTLHAATTISTLRELSRAAVAEADSKTPLSRAAEKGDEAVEELLLARDSVDPSFKDIIGRTPLS
ncbi:hypothetical protein HIM_10397 [Hirsutella minnesotensis 3608]|uniref:Protein kinase domain-containing protein n=1 Tax=Hirsutella minnesotensis 3608 TaxID=1043627 RepID=A0A0F7ZG37_9HYPO|nr:hypothetical protein HIM_10397 [Hirsutella minnesotensis 3608]